MAIDTIGHSKASILALYHILQAVPGRQANELALQLQITSTALSAMVTVNTSQVLPSVLAAVEFIDEFCDAIRVAVHDAHAEGLVNWEGFIFAEEDMSGIACLLKQLTCSIASAYVCSSQSVHRMFGIYTF